MGKYKLVDVLSKGRKSGKSEKEEGRKYMDILKDTFFKRSALMKKADEESKKKPRYEDGGIAKKDKKKPCKFTQITMMIGKKKK